MTSDGYSIATVWPANAVLLAIMLRPGQSGWPVLVFGLAANIAANYVTRGSFIGPLLYGLSNLAEVSIAAFALRSRVPEAGLMNNPRRVFSFVIWGGLIAPAMSGVSGATTAWLVFDQPFPETFKTWFSSDSLGLMIFTPLFSAIFAGDFQHYFRAKSWGERAEALAWLAVTAGIVSFVFTQTEQPVLFVTFAPLMLITFRIGRLGTKLAVVIVAVIGAICTTRGLGPVSAVSADGSTQALFFQCYLAVLLLTTLPVAGELTARQNAERALRENEARYRGLVEDQSELISLATPQGELRFVNPAYARLYGREPSAMIGLNLLDWVPEQARGAVIEDLRKACACRQSVHNENQVLLPDGRTRWIAWTNRAIADGQGDVLIHSVGRDIEEQVVAEQRLKASEEHLRHLYEATPAMLHSIDAGGKLLTVSNRWLAKLGYERHEVIGRQIGDFLKEESREQAMTVGIADLFGRGQVENVPYQVVAKDGSVVDVRVSAILDPDSAGRPLRTLSVVEDVTVRLAAEKALQASEARYRMLAESTSDVITQLDLDLVRRYVSPTCRTILGYEAEEMLDITPGSMIHPDDAPAVRAAMLRLTSGEMPNDRATTVNRMRHKAGHWVWLEAGLSLVRAPGTNAPQHLICVLRDVTERQRVAEALQAAKLAAENATRAKAEFVANMSHELRTPLTGILGLLDLLRNSPVSSPQQARYLDLASQAGQSLMSIVNDVLDFSKIEAGHLMIEATPFDPHALIEGCCDFVRADAGRKSLRIESHIEGASGWMLGDGLRLRQVILNLLTNAVKFTSHGGVRLEARYMREPACLRISVTDTGIGIAADKLDMIFDRFSQADGSTTRNFGGTGLGLAICKKLVELMGGSIAVTSEPGRGSRFWFELPLPVLPAIEATKTERPSDAKESHRILLAEDNPIIREMVTAMLAAQGYAITAVKDGTEAVAVLAASTFSLVLMDIQMPVMDGFTATLAIREAERAENRRAVPIIGLTANAMNQDKARCLHVGMDAHVAKPIHWETLFAVMDDLFEATARTLSGIPVGTEDTAVDLDIDHLDRLAEVLGRDRLVEIFNRFIGRVAAQSAELTRLEVAELSERAHTWVSLAGHLGFLELSRLSSAVEEDLRLGKGPRRVADLHSAAERALAAARTCSYAEAA